MKILFVINHLAGGGAERVFVDLLKMIDRKLFDVTVLVVHDCGIYTSEVKKLCRYQSIIKDADKGGVVGLFYKSMCSLGERLMKYLPAKLLHKWFVKDEYDVEVAYIEGQSTKIVSGADADILSYAWVHTNVIKNPWSECYFRNCEEEHNCYRNINHVIAVSKDVKQGIEKKFGVPADVQYNILNDVEIKSIASDKKRSLKRNASCVLVSVGSMWKVKGYTRLVEAVHQLIRDNYDVQLNIIGDGDERESIERYVIKNNLQSRIKLHGFIRNPYDLLVQADIYVCPSYIEGFSTSVTEALILGIPVLTTDCSGMREILGDSEHGLIVENSEMGLLHGLKTLLDNPDKTSYYSERAVQRGKDFTAAKEIVHLESMFVEGLRNKRERRYEK